MKRKHILMLILGFALTACASNEEAVKPKDDSEKEELLRLVNDLRSKGCTCGNRVMLPAPAVQWNNTLESVAFRHSEDMRKNGYFSHTGKDGSSPGDRITAAGYRWSMYSENIANGQKSASEVFTAWRNSPTHCQNMMGGGYKEMGVGRSGDYWTQVFATQR
jgi:uncharacterized protein YkwD